MDYRKINFPFVAIIGLIALASIEVKTSILLVDFTNQLRPKGKPLDAAIREAGGIRFFQIVLTTITAIGGLISSTLLSRIVTPVMYKLLPPKV